MKRIYFFFSFLFLFGQIKAQVKINEIMASNVSVIADNIGDYTDWVELYNPSSSPIDLASYYITDDLAKLTKFRFTTTAGQVVVPANGYLLIWASGAIARGPLHTSFSLSASGEAIALVSPDGLTIIDSFSFTKQRVNVSYGRLPDGGSTFKFFAVPTPLAANTASNSYDKILDSPTFSRKGGFFDTPFSLTISTNEPGATILYTLDGSNPKSSSLTPQTYRHLDSYPGSFITEQYQSYTYSSPINIVDRSSQPNKISNILTTFNAYFPYTHFLPSQLIHKGTVVRAKIIKAGCLESDIATDTYIYNTNGVNKYSLPVISLSVQENELFDYDIGIYTAGVDYETWRQANPSGFPNGGTPANYHRDGIELSAHLGFIEKDTIIYQQDVGLNLHGSWSSALSNKGLDIFAKGQYSDFNHKIFPQLSFTSFKSFLLRTSGQDHASTMFRDAFVQETVSHLNFSIQAYRPSIVFLNGEYWGLHNLRQRQDKHYYKQLFGVDTDSLDLIKDIGVSREVTEGDSTHYTNMVNYIKTHDLQQTADYEYIKTQLSVESFTDYQIAEIYYNNVDWPWNNIRLWRKRIAFNENAPLGHDGRWRWSFYDADYSLSDPSDDKLANASQANQPYSLLLYNMLLNQEFKNGFINRFADLLNTTFLPTRLTSIIQAKKDAIAAMMPEHCERWHKPWSVSDWETEIQNRIDFINQRPAYQRQHILSQFGISGEYNLTVNVSDTSAGYVRVNTIDIRPSTPGVSSSPYPWTGSYFKNITIKIHARPKPGYKFKHWLFNSTTLTDSVLTLTPAAAIAYTAVFESATFSSNPIPGPYVFNACKYQLLAWNDNAPAASYPDSMRFVYMASTDPLIGAAIAGFTTGLYNYTSKTRINGLGNLGFSFINTGSGNTGYPAQQLGGALLTISTANIPKIKVSWKGRTIVPNSKEYAIRLQARVGDLIAFTDVLDNAGNPIEYHRSPTAGDSLSFTAELPAALLNQPFIQLLWRYYYTGIQNNLASGARDQLAVDDIMIETEKELTGSSLVGTTYYKADKIISTVNVLSTSVLDYTAGQSVTLSPGFCTNNGTVFVAKIGCN